MANDAESSSDVPSNHTCGNNPACIASKQKSTAGSACCGKWGCLSNQLMARVATGTWIVRSGNTGSVVSSELCLAGAGKKGAEAEKSTVKPQKTPQEVQALEDFNKITEAASALMDAGEMDIYSAVREELQRAADAFKDDDDMFAAMDEDDGKVHYCSVCTTKSRPWWAVSAIWNALHS